MKPFKRESMAGIKKLRPLPRLKPLKPLKPLDRMQNMKTLQPLGKNKWVKAHWRYNYATRQWEWVLGHWAA